MSERKIDSVFLIVFLIFSILLGFSSAYFLKLSSLLSYVVVASLCTLTIYGILLLLYQSYKKKTLYRMYHSYLARGCYREVTRRIDSDSKEMKDVWEFKLLALFHSGNTKEFMRLYRNYMNEVNECATLMRYQICLLHDILLAVESPNKPVSFLKNIENTKHKYTKSLEYQLYHNIFMGLKEYYQPQRNLVKVYFEKFLQQTQEISKPLNFYLYYLMTITMFENNHPLCETYSNRTQSFIYDDTSLQLVNTNIKQRMNSMQKGSGDQALMDRQKDDRNFLNDIDMTSSFDSSFNMEETGFRTMPKADEGFVKKRHASEFQSDFDALNASVQNSNAFNLYEEHEFDEMAPRQQRSQRSFQQPIPMQEEEIDVDLDPTWFARSTIKDDEPIVTANFSMRNPRMQEAPRQEMESFDYHSKQARQDSFTSANTYRDVPVEPTVSMNTSQSVQREPAFMNTRTFMDTTPQANHPSQNSNLQQNTMQGRNPMMNQNMRGQVTQQGNQPQMQQQFPNQVHTQTMQNQARPQSIAQPSQMQRQRMQNATMMQQNMVNTPQDRFARFQQESAPNIPQDEMMQRRMSNPMPQNKAMDTRKQARKEKRIAKQDPFGFNNPNAMGKDPFLQEEMQQVQKQAPRREQARSQPKRVRSASSPSNSYRQYVKRNMSIAAMTLLNALIISIASSSFVYMQFFYKYPINSDMVSEIVLSVSLVALLVTYLIAGIHTGWTILKKPISTWSMIAKCIASPLLLIVSLLIGAISEIPYLIYATIKANNENTIH